MKGKRSFASEKLDWELKFASSKMRGAREIAAGADRPASIAELQKLSETAYDNFYSNGFDSLLDQLLETGGCDQSHEVMDEFQSIVPETRWCMRCFVKPLGYAGDYEMMQYLYTFASKYPVDDYSTLSGWALDRWAINCGYDVKDRAAYLSDYIFSKCSIGSRPVARTMSIACGPLEEYRVLQSRLNNYQGPMLAFTGLDADAEALAHVQSQEKKGCSERSSLASIELHKVNVVLAAKGRRPTPILPPQDLIYSVGLMDYLDDHHFVQVANWAFDLLIPGGELILGNFLEDDNCKAVAAVKAIGKVLDWHLIYRSQQHLRELIGSSKFGAVGSKVSIVTGATGLQAYLHVQRPLLYAPASRMVALSKI